MAARAGCDVVPEIGGYGIADGSLPAPFEDTVLVTRDGCEILTPPLPGT